MKLPSDKLAPLWIGIFLAASTFRASAVGSPPTSWAEEEAKGHFPYHRLTAADFPVNDAVHLDGAMYTRGFFRFTYRDHWTELGGHAIARIIEWNVWSGFDRNASSRKSWFKKIAERLPHEQGHLDLSELHHKALAETPLDQLPVGEGATRQEAEADLQRKIAALCNRVTAETQLEQDRYDAETANGANAAKQREWSAEIQARLQVAGIHF